jgi:hypothetical protein
MGEKSLEEPVDGGDACAVDGDEGRRDVAQVDHAAECLHHEA